MRYTINSLVFDSCEFFLNSPCVYLYSSSEAKFCLLTGSNNKVNGYNFYSSKSSSNARLYQKSCYVKPIVTLKSSAKIDTSDTTIDGHSRAKALKLVEQ